MLITPISENEINIKLEKEEKGIVIQSPEEGNKITDYLKELNNEMARLRSELYERDNDRAYLTRLVSKKESELTGLIEGNKKLKDEIKEFKDPALNELQEELESARKALSYWKTESNRIYQDQINKETSFKSEIERLQKINNANQEESKELKDLLRIITPDYMHASYPAGGIPTGSGIYSAYDLYKAFIKAQEILKQ